jgi:FKBP-type peptidyl-prolyl cis-trans isomerase SlyD
MITKNKVVELHYTLRLTNGEEVDTTFDEAPLPYLHGHNNIVPGLEQALEGRDAGDRFTIEIPPEAGYGIYDESNTEELPLDDFPEDVELMEGDEIFVEDEEGNETVGYIEEINAENGTIFVDYNHPLAGETLVFDVEVVSVRDATSQEMSQGFAEDPYGDDDDEEWEDDDEWEDDEEEGDGTNHAGHNH